mmetsp:Transcript_22751/g.49843  ORF Transcript_22751/g.49843 Transcript_22751/m.49843 type:complete len:84 (-) Transcript_22751:3959-4210(-)
MHTVAAGHEVTALALPHTDTQALNPPSMHLHRGSANSARANAPESVDPTHRLCICLCGRPQAPHKHTATCTFSHAFITSCGLW